MQDIPKKIIFEKKNAKTTHIILRQPNRFFHSA